MILKGSARAAPGELAHHLLREDTNEAVRVLELSGVASLDLPGALAELDAMGAGSRSKRTLYHASINTPIEEQLTPEQQVIARERLASKMELTGQPYAVVEHVKAGRQHTHIVWSRIDVATGRAISDSHNYRRHEEVARELEREFGHERVLGAHVRDKANEPRPGRAMTWAEQKQAERSGLTPATAKAIVTELWRKTTTGYDFRHRLEAEGFMLARGNRRDFVLIDAAGELHGLSRRIEGAKARDVRERMADLDADQLPDIAEARRQLRARQRAQEQAEAVATLSPSERLRLDELQREVDAKGQGGGIGSADREILSAMRQLEKTMAGQLRTIVVGTPVYESKMPAAELKNLRAIGRKLTKSAVSEGTDLAATLPQPPVRASVEAENRNPVHEPTPAVNSGKKPKLEPGQKKAEIILAPDTRGDRQPKQDRPSASLFVRIFGWLVEHWQQVLDRQIERSQQQDEPRKPGLTTVPAAEPGRSAAPSSETIDHPAPPPSPAEPLKRETYLDRMRRLNPLTDDEAERRERELAAQRLRDELAWKQDTSRAREWELPSKA